MKKKSVAFLASSAIFYAILDSNILNSITIILAITFLTLLVCFLTTVYLLSFNETIQLSTWRWFRWTIILPVLYIASFIPTYMEQGWVGGGGIYAGLDLLPMLFWAFIVGVVIIIYTLYHRFWLKTGVVN